MPCELDFYLGNLTRHVVNGWNVTDKCFFVLNIHYEFQ